MKQKRHNAILEIIEEATIETQEDQLAGVMKMVKKTIRKVEPDCTLVE